MNSNYFNVITYFAPQYSDFVHFHNFHNFPFYFPKWKHQIGNKFPFLFNKLLAICCLHPMDSKHIEEKKNKMESMTVHSGEFLKMGSESSLISVHLFWSEWFLWNKSTFCFNFSFFFLRFRSFFSYLTWNHLYTIIFIIFSSM